MTAHLGERESGVEVMRVRVGVKVRMRGASHQIQRHVRAQIGTSALA